MLTVVYHRCHAGRPAGEVGCHHGHEHSGGHVGPAATRAAVFAQLQRLPLGGAPHPQVGVGHDDGAGEEYEARQAERVAHVGGVGRVAHQRRGGEVHLDDATRKRDGRQQDGGEAPGEGDEQQRPPARHQGRVLQRVEDRHVPLQADHGQRVHAGGVDGGVAEGHRMAERVGPLGVVLQHAHPQVEGHDQQAEGRVGGGQGEQEVPGVPGPACHGGADHQQHRNVAQSDHQAQSHYDAHLDGPVVELLEPVRVNT